MKKEKLLPCPWCGKVPKAVDWGSEFNIACKNDDCPVMPVGNWMYSRKTAIEAWNTRKAVKE